MKTKLLLCIALILGGGLAVFSASAAEMNSLRVIIIPSTNNVRIREPFGLALLVENPTQINQTVRVMNCSWYEEWQSSNTNVSWIGWNCAKNFAVNVIIPPGGAYTNELQMLIYNLIPDKKVSFRMGFTFIGSNNTLWSNEVQLHILPPDTWESGGRYYRDRNNDGKIDWEGGTKWMGHAVYPFRYKTNSDGSVIATLGVAGQGVDIFKVDTNFDGFYDLEYSVGGTNSQIQWARPIHERVPAVGKDFVPVEQSP